MKSKTKRAYRSLLKQEATEALKLLGFAYNKKEISILTSLKRS